MNDISVVMVHAWVIPEGGDSFLVHTIKNRKHAVQEPGNLRFDILQDPEDELHFILYEVYETAQAAAAHKTTPHYLEWKEAVAGLMARPRKPEVFRMCVHPGLSEKG